MYQYIQFCSKLFYPEQAKQIKHIEQYINAQTNKYTPTHWNAHTNDKTNLDKGTHIHTQEYSQIYVQIQLDTRTYNQIYILVANQPYAQINIFTYK